MADASFFPTPLEIAGGLRWMRAHPVVATAAAAAAATAVSVLTFLQTRADMAGVAGDVADADAGADADARGRGDEDALRRPVAVRGRVRRRPEDCRKLSEDVCSTTDSDASSSPTRGRRSSFDVDAEDTEDAVQVDVAIQVDQVDQVDRADGADGAEDDASASPHWGWYVSTTPPEDRFE